MVFGVDILCLGTWTSYLRDCAPRNLVRGGGTAGFVDWPIQGRRVQSFRRGFRVLWGEAKMQGGYEQRWIVSLVQPGTLSVKAHFAL